MDKKFSEEHYREYAIDVAEKGSLPKKGLIAIKGVPYGITSRWSNNKYSNSFHIKGEILPTYADKNFDLSNIVGFRAEREESIFRYLSEVRQPVMFYGYYNGSMDIYQIEQGESIVTTCFDIAEKLDCVKGWLDEKSS